MMIHDYDDEHTLEEEEAMSGDSCCNELDDLEKVNNPCLNVVFKSQCNFSLLISNIVQLFENIKVTFLSFQTYLGYE